jgi:hypothetical protein
MMTRDEILNMPAGREMNRLVAIKVMGYGENPVIWARYSENITAAWQVVENVLKNTDCDCTLKTTMRGWDCELYRDHANAETAPLAICRAALIAVMEQHPPSA